MSADKDVRTCFVIMPFRIKKDFARKDEIDFDKVYKEIIKPSVEGLKERGIRINCVRSDEIELAGLIHERMIAHIAEADVTVVDQPGELDFVAARRADPRPPRRLPP